jgi:hypothetical protein
MNDKPVRRQGLVTCAAKADTRHPVVETRRLAMPDGTVLICRRRETPGRWSRWTAEIPLDEAKRLYAANVMPQSAEAAE